jgi:hypothetical protein
MPEGREKHTFRRRVVDLLGKEFVEQDAVKDTKEYLREDGREPTGRVISLTWTELPADRVPFAEPGPTPDDRLELTVVLECRA